ncbi:MAG: PAS domain-containing protein [Desulfovibrionaceae bacterium]|nr:PAS domain-containing protein [Desulfovibrionaceae bacterium]
MVADDRQTQEQLRAELAAARTKIADLEQALNSSQPSLAESPFVEFFHTAEDPASFLDRNFVYQSVNAAYARYFGRPAEKIVGLRVIDLLGEDIFQSILKPNLERCLAGEHVSYHFCPVKPEVIVAQDY